MRSRFALVLAILFLAAFSLAAQESPPAAAEAATPAAEAAPPAAGTAEAAAPAAEAATPAAEAAAPVTVEAATPEAAPADGSAAATAASPESAPVEAGAEAAPAASGDQSAVEAPAEPAPPEEATAAEATAAEGEVVSGLQAEVERLGSALEEANSIIDELRAETWGLREKADAAEALARSERDAADAAVAQAEAAQAEAEEARAAAANTAGEEADQARAEADDARAEADSAWFEAAQASSRADAAEAEVAALKEKLAELEKRLAAFEASREVKAEALSSWGGLRLDPKAYPELVMKGFDGSKSRLGAWRIADGVATQTDASQFFSRLTFALVQSPKPTLYSFDVKAGPKGWVGAGLHFFAEGVRKPRGYGEGKSLLVWLTRDAKMRGDNETYLQIYRSDDDVNMERVLDAEIKEGVAAWNHLDLLYEPGAEFVVIAVNGTVRAAYRTFFGIGSGVAISLRTLGEGVAFRNLEVRR